jgi:uncharacterized membrane protein YdbT with pleckstrin-like domain
VELADGERVFFHGHPSWRSILPFYVKGLLAAIAAGVVAGLISAAASRAVESGWVVVAVLVVFAVVLGTGLIRRGRITYTITNRRLTIETGLVARDVHETRLEQIQNVRARQSPFERLAGIGTVAFDTAGSAGFDFAFAGIDDPRRLVRTVDQVLHERAVAVGPGVPGG